MSVKRVRMAEETNADAIVTNCPFCMTMLEDGLKMAGLDDRMQVRIYQNFLLKM